MAQARIAAISHDLEGYANAELIQAMQQGKCETESAMRMFARRLFPEAPEQLIDIAVDLPTDGQSSCFNRHKRRKARRGAFVHVFAGESKDSLVKCAHDLGLEHISVDIKEDLCPSETSGFLLSLALSAVLRVLIGGPPCRTYTVCRHIPAGPDAPRPVRSRNGPGRYGLDRLSPIESGLVNTDDVLFIRFLLLGAITLEASKLLGLPDPAFRLEEPDDPESYLWPAPDNVSANPIYVNRPADRYPSFWATSEWERFQNQYKMNLVRFDQGPLGHARRKPTGLGTNMVPEESLVDLEGPGGEISHHSNSLGMSSKWAKWAPGLVQVMIAMIKRHLRGAHGQATPHKLASVSADFIRHVQRGHIPFRRDCQICLQGAAQVRARRKVLHPDSWTLSMDLSGPFALSKDEFCEVRYMLVGVLTVPILEKKPQTSAGHPSGEANPDSGAPDAVEAEAEVIAPGAVEAPVLKPVQGPLVQGVEHHANVDPDQAVLDAALGAADDDEFLRGNETDEEVEDPIPVTEDHKAAASSWLDVLQADRESYKKEATDCLLHKVQVMEIPFIENLPNKTQSTVVAGIQRVIARCSYHNQTVRRFYSDRGRELNNAKLRDYLAARGVHKTVAFPDEPQSSGRAESTIRGIKATTRTVLQEHDAGPGEWALAAKYATHCLRLKPLGP